MGLFAIATLPARAAVAGAEPVIATGRLVARDGPVRCAGGYEQLGVLTAEDRPLGRALGPGGIVDRLLRQGGLRDHVLTTVGTVERLVHPDGTMNRLLANEGTLDRPLAPAERLPRRGRRAG
ncbi:MAG: hypothetical protein ABI427_04960 [Solirubrobacteraceae bacterium]